MTEVVSKEVFRLHRELYIVETAMFRFKQTFGAELNARSDERQQTEVAVKCAILNRFVAIGMPDTQAVAV